MAEKINIYKRKDVATPRVTHTLSSNEQTSINNILTNFFTYFKSKHL